MVMCSHFMPPFLTSCKTAKGQGDTYRKSDDTRIVSELDDCTIRILDAYNGKQIGDPLTGHDGGVTSVAFSSDSTRIVSGSWDETVQIWDADNGKQIGDPLTGHDGR